MKPRCKKAIRAKKNAFKALLQNKKAFDLQPRYSTARKSATLTVKMSTNAFGSLVSLGFQLFIGKQSILADYSLLAWEKFKYNNLYQGFNWEHS